MNLVISRAVTAALLTAGLLVLTSCSDASDSNGEGPDPNAPRVLERDGVTTVVLGELDGSGDALIEGPVKLTDNGCLAITASHGADHILAWPAGVELLTGDEIGVRVPDVGDVMVGDRLSAGGEYHSPPFDDGLHMPDHPERCLDTADNEVAMIQQKSSINL